MFEYYSNICILYRGGVGGGGGQMSRWSQICSESLIFSPIAHFLQDFPFKWYCNNFFPISMLIRPKLTLP